MLLGGINLNATWILLMNWWIQLWIEVESERGAAASRKWTFQCLRRCFQGNLDAKQKVNETMNKRKKNKKKEPERNKEKEMEEKEMEEKAEEEEEEEEEDKKERRVIKY